MFAALALMVGDDPFGWDTSVRDAVADAVPVSSSDVHIDPFMEGVALAVAGATVALGAWLLMRRRYRAAVFLAVAIGGTAILSSLVEALVERPPIEGPPDEFTFPSGHSAWSLATAAAVALLARPGRERLVAVAAGAVLVLGLGAVIVWEEWHYPSDVLAGWTLALAWTATAWVSAGRPQAR